MDVTGFDMIYKERVYKCIDMMPVFNGQPIDESQPSVKPKFINVCCIDEDGEVVCFYDETFMFRFIRKGRDS